LYVMSLGSGALTRLTQTPNAAEASPSWSPDGRRIVYVSDQSGRPQLYILSRAGGAPARLNVPGSENVSPDWGPDYGSGGWIAYSSRLGGQYQACVVDPQSGVVKTISADGADYEDPSWARDGRHLACVRTVQYRSQVYILDTMGDAPVALTRHDGDWTSPAWSP
jgi:TolB protein